MIVTKKKPIEEMLKALGTASKIFIIGCGERAEYHRRHMPCYKMRERTFERAMRRLRQRQVRGG